MPFNFRWEVTRRHPVYLEHWQGAQRFFESSQRGDSKEDDLQNEELMMNELSARCLNAIGVGSVAPDPTLEFSDIGEGFADYGWLQGAISPVTLRGLWGMLINTLPPDVFASIARQIIDDMESVAKERGSEIEDRQRQLAGYTSLQRIDESALNFMLAEPIVYINPRVSDRQATEDLRTSLARWRAERRIEVGRDRSDNYPDYLRVWDLREGWSGGAYRNADEKTLREVAEELDINPSTASARYRSAFLLITGYEYSPVMWLRFMGIEKLSGVMQDVIGRVASRRPTKLRTRRDIPNSTLGEGDTVGAIVDDRNAQVEQSAQWVSDLMMDLEELIKEKKTDEEILQALEIESDDGEFAKMMEVIELIRHRG